MPNRIIKDTIRTSKTVNEMTDFQFRIWVYLITYVDDYGRGSADPELLKGFVFPRRKRVSESDIQKALAELAGMGCILLYEIDGESYFCFPKWSDHQRVRQCRAKFPAPPDHLPQSAASCGELRQDAARARIESESNPNPNPESESEDSAEQIFSAPPVVTLSLNTGEQHPIFQSDIDGWASLYPAVDVLQELRKMKGWLDTHPQKRKTKRGIGAFITGWLSREQDKGGSRPNQAGGNQFLRRLKEMEDDSH